MKRVKELAAGPLQWVKSIPALLLFSRESLLNRCLQLCRRQLISLTFLRDADGATAHPNSQGINPCVDEVLGLSSSHNCGEQKLV